MKNNIRSIIIVVGGITFMTAMDWLLNDILFAIIYGIAFCMIMGSFLYQSCTGIARKKLVFLHFFGVALLSMNNVLVFSNISAAILLSLSFLISVSGTYLLGFAKK